MPFACFAQNEFRLYCFPMCGRPAISPGEKEELKSRRRNAQLIRSSKLRPLSGSAFHIGRYNPGAPVSISFTVTLASLTAAPEVSSTFPEIAAVVTCAHPATDNTESARLAKHKHCNQTRQLLNQPCFFLSLSWRPAPSLITSLQISTD